MSSTFGNDDPIAQQWYRPVIPRAVLKDLMKRSDAEGWKNFGLWLGLLVLSGVIAAICWRSWWAVPAFFVVRHDLFFKRCPLARTCPRHAIQDALDERHALSPVFLHDDPRGILVGAGVMRAITPTPISSSAILKSRSRVRRKSGRSLSTSLA